MTRVEAMSLTKRQHKLLQYIEAYRERGGISPTFQEMASNSGRSISTVHGLVKELINKGYLQKGFNRARSVEPLSRDPDEIAWPSHENEYRIPPGARFVPVTALDDLFAAWLRRRGVSDR